MAQATERNNLIGKVDAALLSVLPISGVLVLIIALLHFAVTPKDTTASDFWAAGYMLIAAIVWMILSLLITLLLAAYHAPKSAAEERIEDLPEHSHLSLEVPAPALELKN